MVWGGKSGLWNDGNSAGQFVSVRYDTISCAGWRFAAHSEAALLYELLDLVVGGTQ